MAELPRGTVTFLFTDIEGSTRLLKQLGERYGVARADHHRLLRAAFEEYGGQEIDTQGDAFFVAFPRARDAVAAAAGAQRALAAHEWPQGVPLRVRMGMHTGEPSVSEEGYLGLGVHRAARICSAGHGGQVLLSQATVALLEDDELAGVELRDLGRHQLKDFDRPERIHQLVIAGLPDSFPPLKALQSQPDEATPFEGREGELAAAVQAAVVGQPWYRRRAAVLALAGLLVGSVAVAGALLFTGGSKALTRIDTDSAGLIDASSGDIEKQVAVGSSPGAIAVGAGAVWVAAGNRTVSRIDPHANLVTQTISLDATPSGIAFGGGAVWVTSSEDRSVRRIGPSGTRAGARIPVGNGASAIAVGDGAVWVANRLDDTVSKVPTGPGRTSVFRAGLTPSGVAVAKDAVWVSNEAAGTVSRIDPVTGALQTINVGNGPTGIAVGHAAVWVANSLDDTVSRIDPDSSVVTATIPVGVEPSTVATGAGSVWVTNSSSGSVSRIDPRTNSVSTTIQVGDSPGGLGVTGAGVWVSARGPITSHRGGVLTALLESQGVDAVDPAAAYTVAGWAVAIMTNDGLVTFKRVAGAEGGQLVPDLATSVPRPSDGGRTYTFQLRRGIRYSDGRPVRARDFRRELERFFEVHRVPPFFQSIVGAPACVRHPRRCDLGRGVITNDGARTVTFHLSAPDPEFLYQLALPFAVAVPANTPSRIARTGSLVPATGPYMIARFVPTRRLELVRNPRFHEWSQAAQPAGYPDRIVLIFDKPVDAQVTAVERNRADLMMSGFIPPGRIEELTSRYADRVQVNTRSSLEMMFLNVRTPPFDHLSVRRALSYATDRDETIRLGHGANQGVPTCQILPPNFPGFRPYCPYTRNPSRSSTWTAPDLRRAKKLIAGSHTRGTKVTVWAWRDPGGLTAPVDIARYFVSLLNRLGYHASLKVVSGGDRYFRTVGDPRTHAQIGFGGWIADYLAASAFINPLLGCQGFRPQSPVQTTNYSQFCDRRIDAKLKRALRVQATDPTAAGALWAEVDRDLADAAPVVALETQKVLGLVSERVGNYQYSPQWGVLLDQLWVR